MATAKTRKNPVNSQVNRTLDPRQSYERTTRWRRVGREAILDAAADRFDRVDFASVTAGVLTARRVAEAVGVSLGTITHHFPPHSERPGASLPYAALRWALGRVGNQPVDAAADALAAAADRLAQGDPNAVAEIATALTQDMLEFSPDGGPRDKTVESEEVAFFLAAAVAPHDALAAEAARDFCTPMRATYERTTDKLLEVTGRRYASGFDGKTFAVVQGALCDGFVWLRRFDRDAAPADLLARAWMRLFEACTVPAADIEERDIAESLVPLPRGSALDPHKRDAIAVAAATVYDTRGWQGLTMTAVASKAGVSRPTVASHFGDRNGLAAAVWVRWLPALRAEAARDARRPVHAAVWNHIDRLAEIARGHRELTAGFLEGVFAYTVKHGPPRSDDPADPRVLVPLPLLLASAIERSSSQFRPGNAETPAEAVDTAALLTNAGLHLAMTRPGLRASEVATRICDTMLAGMLRRRPTID